jgi:hypothetical protein
MTWVTFLLAWFIWFAIVSFLAGVFNQQNIARHGDIANPRKSMGAAVTAWLITSAGLAGATTFLVSLF